MGAVAAGAVTVVIPSTAWAQTAASRTRTQPTNEFAGRWRVSMTTIAPWVKATDTARVDRNRLLARVVHVGATSFTGLPPFDCRDARYERTRMEPEGLFQGNLPAPAQTAAQVLGFAAGMVDGVRLMCATGLFEFHTADRNHLLTAIDNVILTLDRSPGALASPTSPSGVVQALLERHARDDFTFKRATTSRLQPWLDARLNARISAYFNKPVPAGDAGDINYDPFTSSQEIPARFTVQAARITGPRAEVIVQFVDGGASRSSRYVLQRSATAWRVSDVILSEGSSFMQILRDATK